MKTNDITRPGGYIKFIAYLQIIGIILVVAGHSLHEYPDGFQGRSTLFYRSFQTFRMPLFLFVSGLLMVYTTRVIDNVKTTPVRFAKNKLKRLLLPFAVLTAVTFFPRSMTSSMADDMYPMTLGNFLLAFVDLKHMPIPFFWFLQASFILLTVVFSILYGCKKRGYSPKKAIIILCVLFVAIMYLPIDFPSWFALYNIQNLGVFFVLGCAYCIFADKIDRYVPWTKIWFLFACLLVWAVLFALFSTTAAEIFCSVAGIAMCISLARILEDRDWRFLDHLMGANYIIFLLSWYCNIASQQVLAHFISLPWWVHTALSLISGIYVPWLVYKYLEKHQESRRVKVVALLLGQSFRKKNAK